MKAITKTFNVYNFNELSKEVQKKVIEREAEGIKDLEIEDFLKEEMEFYAQQLLEENFGDKAIFKNVYYGLNYRQGDGAMIEFELAYYGKNLIIQHNSNCYYYNANSIEIVEIDKELTDKQYENLKEKIYNINKELEKYGYDFIEEDRTSTAIEQLKDCMFYENGDIY